MNTVKIERGIQRRLYKTFVWWDTSVRSPIAWPDLSNGDALGLLTGGGLGVCDCQDSVFHRGLDILRLYDPHQLTVLVESVNTSHRTYLGTLRETNAPGKPPGSPLTDSVPMLVFLGRLGDLPGDDEVPSVHVDVDLILGQPGKLERGRHEVFFWVLV